MKIITICGSLRFVEELKRQAERLELAGACVLSIVYPTKNPAAYRAFEIARLRQAHLKRIDCSDAIFVVNPGGYIGETTQYEINYAHEQGKEVFYLEK